jgi:hypothetical protein
MNVKTDENSIFHLCNSLNAVAGMVRGQNNPHLEGLLLTAQATITKLYEENQALRSEKA